MLPLKSEWLSISADKVNALDIKGYRRRAYYYNEFFYTYIGWNAETHYDRFILIVYQNENDLMCEIRCMGSSYSSEPDTTTIDPDIIRKFYNGLRWSWRCDFVNSRIEEIDGRMFIHGIETNLLEDISSYRKEIDELNGRMEEICELSANAMNTLSEKYGIEISI